METGIRKSLQLKVGLQLKDMTMNNDEVFDQVAGYQSQGTGFGENAEKLILGLANDYVEKGWLKEEEKIEWAKGWYDYAQKTQCIESDCDYETGRQMENKYSTAKGAYQFLTTEYGPEDTKWIIGKDGKQVKFTPKNSVEVARTRVWNTGLVDKGFIENEAGEDMISDNPINWTEDQADVMFISNIAMQPGSDSLVIDVGNGINYHSTYEKFHYAGDIDKKTKDRMNEKYGKEE
jgi:hypothetical protein